MSGLLFLCTASVDTPCGGAKNAGFEALPLGETTFRELLLGDAASIASEWSPLRRGSAHEFRRG